MLTAAALTACAAGQTALPKGSGAVDPQAQYVNLAIRGRLLIPILGGAAALALS